jgi:hypothetical protein
MTGPIRCWACGVEPEETYEVQSMEQADAIATVIRWPASTDHEHADRQPTPEELDAAGRVSLLKIQEEWTA